MKQEIEIIAAVNFPFAEWNWELSLMSIYLYLLTHEGKNSQLKCSKYFVEIAVESSALWCCPGGKADNNFLW